MYRASSTAIEKIYWNNFLKKLHSKKLKKQIVLQKSSRKLLYFATSKVDLNVTHLLFLLLQILFVLIENNIVQALYEALKRVYPSVLNVLSYFHYVPTFRNYVTAEC